MRSLKRRRLYEDVIEELERHIRELDLRPGDRLPSEQELKQRLGVSTPVLREAFRTLELRGIVVSQQGRGRFLRCPHVYVPTDSVDVLRYCSVLDILEARKVVELAVVELAVQRASDQDIARLEDLMSDDDPQLTRRWGEPLDVDRDFHVALAAMTGNFFFRHLVYLQMTLLKDLRHRSFMDPEAWAALQGEHRRILHWVKQRSISQAKEAMKEHLDHVGRVLAAYADERRGP